MRLLLFLILYLFPLPLLAAASAPLYPDWERKAVYLEDASGTLTLERALALPAGAWLSLPPKGLNLGFKREPHWFRLPLPPCDEDEPRILEIAYPLIDHISLWFLSADGPAPGVTTGDKFPYGERPLEHIGFRFPYGCGQYQEVLIRVQTTSSMQLPMNIWEPRAFDRHLSDLERPQLLYFGAVLIMALYNFFIYLIVRRPPYLQYVLFVLSFATFQAGISGLGFRYIWPNLPIINVHVIDKSINCIGIFAFAFTLSFLNAKTLTPRLYRISVWLLGSLIAYTFISFAVPGGIAVRISIGFVTTAIMMVLFITAHSIAQRQREGYFYGLAWATFLFGTIALSFNKLGFLPRTALTEYSQQISSVLEMLLLSFALADQMNILRFKLALSHEKLEKTLENIEEIVQQKTQSIRSIMDTLELGIITITSQKLLIEAEYSQHTEGWLGEGQLGGKSFVDVFLKRLVLGADARQLIVSALEAIMDEPHESFDFNGFHLPREARLVTPAGPKDIVIEWTPIPSPEGRILRILIAFHDVTELRSLKQVQATQSRMLIRLNQLLNADDLALRVFLLHAERSLEAMHGLLERDQDLAPLVQRLFIDFHTLKGESRTLGLTELSEQFHAMEDTLDTLRKQPDLWNRAAMGQILGSLEGLLAEFAQLYESHIGSLTEERVLSIAQSRLEDWEQSLQMIQPRNQAEGTAHRRILNDLFHILHKDLESYEQKLEALAHRIAKELGKPDPQVLIAGQGLFLSQKLVEQFDHIFIHILQNALVHGLESPSERQAAGKGQAGLISIHVVRHGDRVSMTIRDDGRGVQVAQVKARAEELGLIKSADVMTEERLESSLFHPGFSCRDTVTQHAGRGVGMGAVRQFVEEISGEMRLEFSKEKDGYRAFAIVLTFPAQLFPSLSPPLVLAQ